MISPALRAELRAAVLEWRRREAEARTAARIAMNEEDEAVRDGVLVRGTEAIGAVVGLAPSTVSRHFRRRTIPVRKSGCRLVGRRTALEAWAARRSAARR